MDNIASEILKFWFLESKPDQWFEKNLDYDNLIRKKFDEYHKIAIFNNQLSNEFINWKKNAKESLALIILIDQFSRNLYRNNSNSFKFDHISLEICKNGLKKYYLKKLNDLNEKLFFILPLIHNENIQDQKLALKIANIELVKHPDFDKIIKFFSRHKEIIEIFGRFPHRNTILNRESTNEEINFLKTPFSSF